MTKIANSPEIANAAPTVSVIMPAYNVAAFIGEALQSVLSQTFTDYEVIVVNDGSPDTEELERVLQPFQSRIRYLKQENRGVSAARNAGIRAARGSFVAHLDPDDAWEPEYLAAQLAVLNADPSIDVLYPDALIFGDAPEAGLRYMQWCASEGEVTVENLFKGKCHVMCSVTARREALLRAGLFDEDLRCAEDFDLWLRLMKSGGRISYHRRVLVRYRRRASSHTADAEWLSKSLLRVLEKAEKTMDLSAPELEALNDMRKRVRANAALERAKQALQDGDAAAAHAQLMEANSYFRSARLSLIAVALRVAPGLLRRVYGLRDRHVWHGAKLSSIG